MKKTVIIILIWIFAAIATADVQMHPIPNHSTSPDMLPNPENNADHDGRYYTKRKVNDIVAGNTFDYFLNNTLSGIGAPEYFTMDATETGEAESTFSDTIANDAFLIDSFVTTSTQPTFTDLVAGIYSLHIHADTTVGVNVKTTRLFWELYSREADSPFTETLILTSEESGTLTGSDTEYDMHGSLTAGVILNETDRLLVKIYGNIEDGDPPRNTDPLVTIKAEGTTFSHMEVVTNVTAFDDRYVFVTGDTMTGPLVVEDDIRLTGILTIGSATFTEVDDNLTIATAGTSGDINLFPGGSASIVIGGRIIPDHDDGRSIGTPSLQFSTLYLSQSIELVGNTIDIEFVSSGIYDFVITARLGGDLVLASDDGSVVIGTTLLPTGDDDFNLGAPSRQWKNLWIDGIANIDSLVANTAEIIGGTMDNVQVAGATLTGMLFINDDSDDLSQLGSQGADGQVLTSAGAGVNPAWEDASGGVSDHDLLNNLAWSVAGHTIDTSIDFNSNNITEMGNITGTGDYNSTGTVVLTNTAQDTLLIQTSGSPTGVPNFDGVVEFLSSIATPITTDTMLTVNTFVSPTDSGTKIAGAFFLRYDSDGGATDQNTSGVGTGLKGGVELELTSDNTSFGLGGNFAGLDFSVKQTGDFDLTNSFLQDAAFNFIGANVVSQMGSAEFTLDGAGSNAFNNIGGKFSTFMLGNFNVPTGENYGVRIINSATNFVIGEGSVVNNYGLHITNSATATGDGTLNSWGIYVEQGILLAEQAAASPNKAGSGQIWVRDDGVFMFTYDGSHFTVNVTAI